MFHWRIILILFTFSYCFLSFKFSACKAFIDALLSFIFYLPWQAKMCFPASISQRFILLFWRKICNFSKEKSNDLYTKSNAFSLFHTKKEDLHIFCTMLLIILLLEAPVISSKRFENCLANLRSVGAFPGFYRPPSQWALAECNSQEKLSDRRIRNLRQVL